MNIHLSFSRQCCQYLILVTLYGKVRGMGTGNGYYLLVCFLFVCFYLCFCLLVSHVLSLLEWVEHDSCCVSFFEPTPDTKCKLNISSFLTLPHFLDCLICTRNSVSIILLLWMMGGWDRWGVVASYQGLGGGTGGGYYLLVCFLCLFLFVLLSFGLSCPVSFLSE